MRVTRKKDKKICPERSQRVVVAMSGGVDSSVAAALLKEQGFEAVGVFMKFWKAPGFGENRCCSLESETRARKVAKIIGIPFYVFNFEKEFKKRVVDYFLQEQKAGRTPNPCVVCNKEIKFGLLLEKALELGADFVATGHYARKFSSESTLALLCSADKNKDQSYFLWRLGQKQLSRVLFPIGDYTRAEVESVAKKFKLPFSGVKKSMEVCFIPGDTADFLMKHFKIKKGDIIEKNSGKKIGEHQGVYFYTIGQRRGIGLAGGPYYVVDKDAKKNILFVSKSEKDLEKKEILVKGVNWISGKEPKFPLRAQVKIRYRSPSARAVISKKQNAKSYTLMFSYHQRAVTSGQSAVFYKGNELVGGGVIC